ncbi:MAG TPA: hypothetical protein VLF19_03650, partial [Methylomirabilota bacterium]|nr:hypothetical protein [Methylomirabilota bacterium]
ERLLQIVELERLDDGLDLFHRFPPGRMWSRAMTVPALSTPGPPVKSTSWIAWDGGRATKAMLSE